MIRSEYETAVREILIQFTDRAATTLRNLFAVLPEKTKAVSIEVFVDQDGEGFLDVQVSLDGPDLYVLNRAIAPYATLFETKMTEDGLVPPLPLMPGGTNFDSFSVPDVLADSAATWLRTVWQQAHIFSQLPVSIVSHDQIGTLTPIDLNQELPIV